MGTVRERVARGPLEYFRPRLSGTDLRWFGSATARQRALHNSKCLPSSEFLGRCTRDLLAAL
jgi:hypothetical protein